MAYGRTSTAALIGFDVAETIKLELSEVMKLLMIFGREEGVFSGRIGMLIDWSMSKS